MATVETHRESPTPPPPTFDLLGLTLHEAELLCGVLGRLRGSAGLYGVYDGLTNAVQGAGGNGYRFTAEPDEWGVLDIK